MSTVAWAIFFKLIPQPLPALLTIYSFLYNAISQFWKDLYAVEEIDGEVLIVSTELAH